MKFKFKYHNLIVNLRETNLFTELNSKTMLVLASIQIDECMKNKGRAAISYSKEMLLLSFSFSTGEPLHSYKIHLIRNEGRAT